MPEELIRQVKRKAAAEGRSLTALTEVGLRRLLNEATAVGRQKRVLPPVSSAKGGPMPGVDLNDSAALQELDDIARAARLR